MKPLYKHNCDECIFIGTTDDVDMYHHALTEDVQIVVARYGHDDSAYEGGWDDEVVIRNPYLFRAKKLAMKVKEGHSVNEHIEALKSITDALFHPVKSRHPATEVLLDDAVATTNKLQSLLLVLARKNPHSANIEEAQEMAEGIALNIIGYRKELNAPQGTCGCGGKCDACVAARSDERYDRKRDGELK